MAKRNQRSNLPPLNALRAFETAVRHGSFISAADELCVTPAAVSQQIKSLEAWIGVDLFDRHAQGISLNDVGKQVGDGLTQSFDLMGHSVNSLLRKARPRTIKIATLPSIAQFWLAPRLTMLRNIIPNLEISITTRETPPNLKREPFEFSLFLEESDGDDGGTVHFFRDEIFPVCAPVVAERLVEYSDLASETLLSDETWHEDWNKWASSISKDTFLNSSGPVFSLYGLALQETISGAGVLMGHGFLVEEHLKRGELVAPFSDKCRLSESLRLKFNEQHLDDLIIREIVNVLLQSCRSRAPLE